VVHPSASWSTLTRLRPILERCSRDGGREFVEILNTGPDPVSLAGVSLAFANGATGGPWEIRWTGSFEFALESGVRFLITDRNWTMAEVPDVEVWLGLQNGPDAVRLERDGVVLDLVGYGPLTDPSLMEEEPAELKPGLSLARRPDGHDTANNRNDFTPANPTPGSANFQPYEWGVDGWTMEPPSLDRPGLKVVFIIRLQNTGTEVQPFGPVVLRAGEVEATALLDRTEPDRVQTLSFTFMPLVGGLLDLHLFLPPTPVESAPEIRPARLQVGPGSVLLNEVLPRPADGQGEWVELICPGPDEIDLAGYFIGDADGDIRSLPPVILKPGGFVVLAQDSLGLAEWMAANEEAGVPGRCRGEETVRHLAGWPTLNNSAPAGRDYADRVILVDAEGTVVDHVTLDGGGIMGAATPDGRSVERMAPGPINPGFSNWAPCGAVTGATPGCANSIWRADTTGPGLTVVPAILDAERGDTLVHFRFEVPRGHSGWRLQVFDLGGALVRDLGGDDLGHGLRDLIWDGGDDAGRPAGPGGYVALLRMDRAPSSGRRALVVIR